MGRKPKIIVDEATGDTSLRIRIARPIRLLCEELSHQYGFPIDKALGLVLDSLVATLTDPQRGDQAARLLLGPVFAEKLKAVRARHFGAIRSGPTINIDVLHRSARTKSGFEGVYTSGQGHRAMGRVPGSTSTKHLGTFGTAEEAAWVRYLYYSEMNLPYGQWEVDLDRYRNEIDPSARGLSDTDALNRLAAHNEDMQLGHLNMLPGRPKNPSTIRLGQSPHDHATVGDEDDMSPGAMIAEMRAQNDARERTLRDDVKRRQREAVANDDGTDHATDPARLLDEEA